MRTQYPTRVFAGTVLGTRRNQRGENTPFRSLLFGTDRERRTIRENRSQSQSHHLGDDIPIIATVINEHADIQARLDAGVSILNVSAAARTPEVVRAIRKNFPTVPIIATGGPTPADILKTIEAGANCISYTPPSTAEIFADIMKSYRAEEDAEHQVVEEQVTILDAIESV